MAIGAVQQALPSGRRREPINVSDIYAAADRGDLPASAVSGIIEHLANEQTRWALAFGHITGEQTDAYRQNLLKRLRKHQAPIESAAYRRTVGVMAPVTPAEWGVTGAAATGVPYIVAALKQKPITIREAISSAAGPGALPYTALGELVTVLGINPLRDPLYQRKERGYWQSVREGMAGQIEDIGRKSEELRKRYGLLGLPLQAVHGVLNPISGIAYAGKGIKALLSGPEGPTRAKQAELRILEALKED